jgi:hypothetical protein
MRTKEDKFELIRDGIVKWTGYQEGALCCCFTHDTRHSKKRDQFYALSIDRRLYNVHPVVYECSGENWDADSGFRVSGGVYPIRWEVADWEIKEAGYSSAEAFFNDL